MTYVSLFELGYLFNDVFFHILTTARKLLQLSNSLYCLRRALTLCLQVHPWRPLIVPLSSPLLTAFVNNSSTSNWHLIPNPSLPFGQHCLCAYMISYVPVFCSTTMSQPLGLSSYRVTLRHYDLLPCLQAFTTTIGTHCGSY